MHPRYKTEYFQQKHWPKQWIDTAVTLAQDAWNNRYKKIDNVATSEVAASKKVSDKLKYYCYSCINSVIES
jgi:hypothetical protein